MTEEKAPAATKVGPAAQRNLLRAVKAGKVRLDVNGRTWQQFGRFTGTGTPQKRLLSKQLLTIAADWVQLDGDTYRLTEAGEEQLSALEER